MSDIDTIVQDLKDAQWKSNDEIERLQRYEELVQFIANDYHELSHDKAMWQRDDWKKRCKKLIEEDHAQSSN
jgi:iron-sulfur cluster repair protein YtfE (RIC family)